MPEIKNTDELYVECDQCTARAIFALCDKHYNEEIERAREEGRQESKNAS
jgi:hypothetical protein